MNNQITRPQIREVLLRNGFTIAPDRDDLEDRVYEAAFELLELAKPSVPEEPVAIPQISGIGRDTSHPRAAILYLRSEPTDDDIRTIQDALRAGCAQPAVQRTAIQRKYKDWAIVRQSESAVSIVQHGSTYVTFSEGESDKRMPWLVDFLSSLLAGADPVAQAATQHAEQQATPDDELVAGAEFLLHRLREMENLLVDDELCRNYLGHVAPAIARFEGLVAAHRKQGGEA